MLAPVILFVYNRPDHTVKTLEALRANEGSEQIELFIYIDGLKENSSEEQKEKHKKVKEIIRSVTWCKEVHVTESEVNIGLAKSITKGVTEVLEKYDRAIILEDDIVTSSTFLLFMNHSLSKYEKSEEVACISGYIYPAPGLTEETFFIKGADCWGWATWKRAWKYFSDDAPKLISEIKQKGLSGDFNFFDSYPYIEMLQQQIDKKINSWAICWYASAYLNNLYTLYPSRSLVHNIGIDGSGTNSGISDKWGLKAESFMPSVFPVKVSESNDAKRKIAAYFRSLQNTTSEKTDFQLIKTKVKNILNKIKNKLSGRKTEVEKTPGWWRGNYTTWNEAEKESKGYDSQDILDKVANALLKVKKGEAEYERDSYLFYTLDYNWSLVALIQKCYLEEKSPLKILDFGGSLGSTYFQNRKMLNHLPYNWYVIEQNHFIIKGKELLEDEILKFIPDFADYNCNKANIVLFSSVLQYIDNYKFYIAEAIKLNPSYIYIDRTSFADSPADIITVQHTPPEIYEATYPCRFFSESNFLSLFKEKYELVGNIESIIEKDVVSESGVRLYWKGFILKRKD